MDVFRLDPSTYMPTDLVDGYSSMIWTERYSTNGEFQMKTANISYARNLIPEGSLISLRDSNQVMTVDTHTITQDENGDPEATVVGRTFETFLENRDLSTTQHESMSMDDPPKPLLFFTPNQEIMYYLWNDVVGNSAHLANTDIIPNLAVSDSTTSDGPSGPRIANVFGEKYAYILTLLQAQKLGLRTVRPGSKNATLVSFDGTPRTIDTLVQNVPQLRLDIYNGVDRSRGQSVVTPVVLSYESGDMTNPQYVLSLKGYKNVVIAMTSNAGLRTYYGAGASAATSGMDRRVLTVDASNVEWGADISFESAVETFARGELAKYNQTILFDGEVSPLAHYKYNVHYSLGDLVTVSADYDFEQTMRVSEYVRTEDLGGDRGYPTLEVVT